MSFTGLLNQTRKRLRFHLPQAASIQGNRFVVAAWQATRALKSVRPRCARLVRRHDEILRHAGHSPRPKTSQIVLPGIGEEWRAHYDLVVEESLEPISAAYNRFADEVHGRSPLYEELSHQIARDESTLQFLSALPRPKQQPNLLFAAVRYTCGTPQSWRDFHRLLFTHGDQIRSVILARRTQTNEPARCATLLPLLAMLPQPLALLEIGAAAGLCLLPDRYAYLFNGRVRISPSSEVGVAPPTFSCEANADTPLPSRNVEVVWRAGLDLEPVSVHSSNDVAWLEALVWPDEQNRLSLLKQALNVARQSPPRVVAGDLRRDLPLLAAQAPTGVTLVIFHSAVLAYVASLEERIALADAIAQLKAVWVSNEAPRVSPCDLTELKLSCTPSEFLLVKDKQAIACAESHGKSIRWFGPVSTRLSAPAFGGQTF